MRYLFFNLAIIVIFLTTGNSQSLYEHKNGRSGSLGNTSFSYSDNRNLFSAPGSSLSDSLFFISLSVQNHFTSNQLQSFHAGTGFHIKKIKIGFNFSQFGYKYFKEQTFSLASAKQLSEEVSFGVLCHYNTTLINEKSKSNYLCFTLSSLLKISKKWTTSLIYLNTGNKNYIKPNEAGIGLSYQENESLLVVTELIHAYNRTTIRFGIEYDYNRLKIRMGTYNNLKVLTFGIGIPINKTVLDFGTSWDNRLGLSPEMSLYYAK